VQTTENFGFLLSAQTSIDAGININFLAAPAASVVVSSSFSGSIAGDTIVSLSGSAAIPTLTLGGTIGQASFVEVSSAATVTVMTSNVASAKVDTTDCSSLVVTTLNVPGTAVSFFQTCNATGEASIIIPNIQFTSTGGTILVAGGSATLGVDANGNAGTSSGSGTIQLAGGVSVYGNISAGVTLNVAAAGKSAPQCVIDTGKTLSFYGAAITGTGGSIVVDGNLWLAATVTSVQAQVVVNAAAQFTVSSTAAFNAAAWSVATQGKVIFAANCNRASVFVQTISQCLGTVQINLATSMSAFVSAGGSGVGFTYASSNNVQLLAKCQVVVVDSAGASVALTSVVGGSASGRRLLGSGTATWNSNQMNFQTNSASALFLTVPVVVALLTSLF